jgi:hypothetical protein
MCRCILEGRLCAALAMGVVTTACGGISLGDASRDGDAAAEDGGHRSDSGVTPDAGGGADASTASDAAVDPIDGGGETDDIAAAFSTISNPTPTGHFQYGMTRSLGGPFALYPNVVAAQALPLWQMSSSPNSPPYVGKNITSQSVVFFNTVTLPPGSVWAHPGAAGEYSVIRWTCPHSGNYRVNFTFVARDSTTTNVAALKNGATPPLFVGDVSPGSSPAYSDTLPLQAGDTIDLAVGYGTDGQYSNDSTGVAGSLARQ